MCSPWGTGMGAGDALRKLPQDLVTPDVRALAVEIKAMRERVDALEKYLSESIANLKGETKAGFEHIVSQLRPHERVAHLEEERDPKRLPDSKQ